MHMINHLWLEIRRQSSCYWLAQPQITDILLLISVCFHASSFQTVNKNAWSHLFCHNLSIWFFCTLPVMQDQVDKSFFKALQQSYGKPPNESMLPLFVLSMYLSFWSNHANDYVNFGIWFALIDLSVPLSVVWGQKILQMMGTFDG